MRQALVPIHGGVLSALGMLTAPRGRQLSRTRQGLLQEIPQAEIEQELEILREAGLASLAQEGVAAAAVSARPTLDLRYRGQSYTLNVAWAGDRDASAEAFHLAHQGRYGHRLELPVELVNLRLGLRGPSPQLPIRMPPAGQGGDEGQGRATLHGIDDVVTLYRREALRPGDVLQGPALVTEQVSTTFIAPRWRAMVDPHGNLILDYQG
jgi:N-methylhydantoinase A